MVEVATLKNHNSGLSVFLSNQYKHKISKHVASHKRILIWITIWTTIIRPDTCGPLKNCPFLSCPLEDQYTKESLMNFKNASKNVSYLHCSLTIISARKSIWIVVQCAIIASISGERIHMITRKQGSSEYSVYCDI